MKITTTATYVMLNVLLISSGVLPVGSIIMAMGYVAKDIVMVGAS